MKQLGEIIGQLLSSKKAVMTLLGLATPWLASKMGVSEETIMQSLLPLVGLLGAYLLGQGIADHGKEKAKAERLVNLPPREPQVNVPPQAPPS